MNYAAVINTFAPDYEMQTGRIMRFIKDAGMNISDGTLVICGRSENDAACPAGFAEYIYLSAELCMPQTVAGFIQDNLDYRDLFIMPGNVFGSELTVQLESSLNGSSLTGVTSIDTGSFTNDGTIIASRRIYANHVSAGFRMNGKPYCISLDNSLPADTATFEYDGDITFHGLHEDDIYKDLSMEPRDMPADLDAAEYVVIGGNGIGNRRNAEEMSELAESAGMIAAGSRPCVMNAWLPMNRMIGVSGSMISPEIAILLGISGSPAFYEGIKNADKIIAINKDPDAPIGKKADLMISGDCMEIFRLFTEKYNSRAGNTDGER